MQARGKVQQEEDHEEVHERVQERRLPEAEEGWNVQEEGKEVLPEDLLRRRWVQLAPIYTLLDECYI